MVQYICLVTLISNAWLGQTVNYIYKTLDQININYTTTDLDDLQLDK